MEYESRLPETTESISVPERALWQPDGAPSEGSSAPQSTLADCESEILVRGKMAPSLYHAESYFTQVANKGATGDLESRKTFYENADPLPLVAQPRRHGSTASSAKPNFSPSQSRNTLSPRARKNAISSLVTEYDRPECNISGEAMRIGRRQPQFPFCRRTLFR